MPSASGTQPQASVPKPDSLMQLFPEAMVEIDYEQLLNSDSIEYFADAIESPEFNSGRHNTVLRLPSYISSTIAYMKPAELVRERNKLFRERFPHVQISLDAIRRSVVNGHSFFKN